MSDPNSPPEPSYSPQQPEQPVDPFAQPYGYPAVPISYQSGAIGPQRPVSTIVLGIIGILYAIYLTVCTCGGLALMGAGSAFFEQATAAMTPAERAQFEKDMELDAFDIGSAVIAVGVGILAWIGSIGSFMGREIGRKGLLWFAWAFLGMMALGLVVEAIRGFPGVQDARTQFTQQGTGAPPMGIILALVGPAWCCSLSIPSA